MTRLCSQWQTSTVDSERAQTPTLYGRLSGVDGWRIECRQGQSNEFMVVSGHVNAFDCSCEEKKPCSNAHAR